MIKKKNIYDKIVHELSIFSNDIEEKAKNNLLDDNVFSEDFIKDLLNTCMGWDLKNLNTDTKRFPGIDLGDSNRRIGVQVTSTKTSVKIMDSLDNIISNNVDKKYDEIYFFILGRKQKSYSVDFAKYDTLDCSENNIWDISDIITRCSHLDAIHMEEVWNVIKRELVAEDVINEQQRNGEIKPEYRPEAIWRSPITLVVLTWISIILGLGVIISFVKIIENILCLFYKPLELPSAMESYMYSMTVAILLCAFAIVLEVRKIAKNQTRYPLIFGFAISGYNNRLTIEKIHIGKCPICKGNMKYYNKPIEWGERILSDGSTKREVIKRAPVLECVRNDKHCYEVDPAEDIVE